MSQDVSFRRKVIYIVAIVVLLFPLFWIGQPATRTSSGGKLAQLRADPRYNLSQAQLGEIDPASESMKLATLGLRGVAANVLWEKANEYKKKEDWDSLSATLNQITKLQPNFITVWEHQSHNLSYNISVEFDDYRHRYHWVKKGIDFLVEGTHYNRDNPRLLHYTGWITGQKMGRADEHKQFRSMFRADEDFHNAINREVPLDDPVDGAIGYDGRPDSWLVSRLWYLRAERAVDAGKVLRGKSPLIFHADAPMALVNYASTIEEEGILGEKARHAWEKAAKAWTDYGKLAIPTSWGHNLRLGEYPKINDEIGRMQKQLQELAPGVRERLVAEKRAKLTDAERTALDIPREKLTEDTYQPHFEAEAKTRVTHEEIAKEAPEQNRDKAVRLAVRLQDHELLSQRVVHYRGIVNYEYWETRCAAERTKTAIDAREYVFKAKQEHDEAKLVEARDLYNAAWREWKKIYEQFPLLMDDVAADELLANIKDYYHLLQELDEDVPAAFPLDKLLEFRSSRDPEIEAMHNKLKSVRGEKSSEPAPKEDATKPPPAPPKEAKPEPKAAE